MKRIIHILIAILAIAAININTVMAVPPVRGLGLKEPQHKSIRQHKGLARRMARRQSTNKEMRGLIILANYSDVQFQPANDRDGFDSLMNAVNYTYNGAIGSVRKYYRDQSNGQFDMPFDVVGPVNLPNTMAYYGTDVDTEAADYDRYSADLIMDACFMADTVFNVDFSRYDCDNDGIIDFVFIFYAGYGQADGGGATTIWPHEFDIESALAYGYTNQTTYYCDYDEQSGYIIDENLPVLDGCMLMKYACANERRKAGGVRNGIGTACHEFGHVLGLPDYYVTAPDAPMKGEDLEPDAWSIMDYGSHTNAGRTPPNLSAFDKFYLGWITPEQLSGYKQISLPADGQTYCAFTHGALSPTSTDTIWYFESRKKSGWDTYLPGWGMIVWRIIYDKDDWDYNEVNNNTTRVLVVSADGVTLPASDHSQGSLPGIPFPGSSNVTSYNPTNDCEISDISKGTDGTVSFVFGTAPTDIKENLSTDKADRLWFDVLGRKISNPATYNGPLIKVPRD